MMKKFYFAFLTFLLISTVNSFAQVTVGVTPYTTVGAAFAAINAGTHTGAITVNINANTTEPVTAVLNSSGTGAANYTSVLVTPTANVTVTGSIVGAIIKLNGADQVTIDGNNQLTISNTSTSLDAVVVWLASASTSDGATENHILNTTILGSGTTMGSTNTYAGVISSSGTNIRGAADAANKSNEFAYLKIKSCYIGIGLWGVPGNEEANMIDTCTIGSGIVAEKIHYQGIMISNQTDVVVRRNIINGIDGNIASNTNTIAGIEVVGTITNGEIFKNRISDIYNGNLSRYASFGIALENTNGASGLKVYNNFIWNIRAIGEFLVPSIISDNGHGIGINSGGGYNIWNNSISMAQNQDNGANSSCIFVSSGVGSGLNIRNNILSNTQTTGVRYSMYSSVGNANYATGSGGALNYNDYFSNNFIGFMGGQQATLAAWQAATTQDANSVAVNPQFVGPNSNLHLNSGSPLDNVGSVIAGITTDIDGDTRSATPDIGADEFTSVPCNAAPAGGTASFSAASIITAENICRTGTVDLFATSYGWGGNVTYVWQSGPTAGGPWANIGAPSTVYSDAIGVAISATTFYRLLVNCPGFGSNASTIISATVDNPAIATTTSGTRCGYGTVNLGATAPGYTVNWYTALTGGVPIGTGTSFTTPPINTTTTYYAAATAGSGPAIVGPQLLTPGSTTCGGISVSNLADWPVRFDVMAPITIQSVKVVVVGTSINVGLRASLSNVNIATFNHTYTPAEISAGIATLPLNFVINTAGNYQLTNISGGVGRIPSMSCSYPFNSPGGNFSIVGSAIFSTTSTSTAYYNSFFDFVIVEGCEGTRVAVLATVNTPPAMTLSASPSTTICSGSSVTITATSANPNYTYLWQPGNIAGASISVTPSGTGYYIVTATDITTTPVCVNKDSILITVNPTPANINLAPATASICPNNILNLFVTGGVVPNQTIVHTNVNTGPSLFQADDLIVPTDWISNLISGPAVTQFTRRASPYMGYFNTISNDNSTFFYSDADAGGPGNTTNTEIVSPVMDFTGLGADGAINFWHAYLAWFNDIEVAVQYRVGAGAWNNIQDYNGSSQGTATNFVNANLLLTAVPRVPNVQIRFHYESIWGYYWAIDNIRITGTNTAPITWTYNPGPNPLWATNAGSGGAAYVGGTNATQVWFETGTINTYTVVAHAGSGACTKTDTSIVTVTSAGGVASIGLSSSDGDNKVCAGDSITFSALPSGQMGANANYLWWLDADGPGAGGFVLLVGPNTPPDFTYTYTPATAVSYIKVSMRKKPSDPCTSYPAGDSVFAQVTVYRYSNTSPTISGAVAGCVAPPNINLTANPSSVDITYQWMLNGTPIGGATAQVYGAPGPGNYSVAVINGNACFDTATHVITATNTYTITATATANGMLTPIGAVPVNCNADTSFTAVANVGFTILDVIVDAVSLGPQASPYVYTFLNVNVNHTIHVVFGLAGCATPASVSMVDTVNICAGNVFSLSDASASVVNAATATWSTAPGWGSGTFSPSTAWGTATTYTPSAADITAGIVKIVLLSNVPPSPCNLASSDTLILRIYGKPSVGTTGIFGYCPSSNTTITANAVFPGAVAYQWYNGVAVTPIGGATMPAHNFNASGTYSVVATGTPGGCKDTSSFTIIAATDPTVTIGGPNLVCEGSTSTSLSSIPVAGSGPITGYQWYTGPTWPATPVVIETNPSYNIPVANQTYWVQVTDSYGCTAHNPTGHAVAIDMSPLNGSYTIGPGGQTCSNFASFDSAVSALNRRGISGDVTIQAVSGIVETVPVGGLKLGPVAGNTGTRRIRFTNDGLGAHPLLKAFAGGSATPATVTAQDGIWSISGVDNLTIDGIDLLDENTLNNATMEYGYGFFKVSGTDGCQNDSVINCVITLNKVNNVTGAGTSYEGNKGIWMVNSTSTAPTTALTVTAASGSNSNNRFYNNTISNVHNGIVLYGFAASAGVGPSPSPATFYGDLNNDIGGAVNTNGNTITNYGSNSVAVANIAAAIRVRYQWSNNISFNNINNNNGSGEFHSGVLKGILTADGASANITISNNTIDVKSGSTTAACSAIDNAIGIGAALGQAVNITSNIITGSYTTATSGIWEGIRNQNVNAPTMNINGNRIQNVSNVGTGTWSAIYNIGSSNAVLNINNNVVSNNTINGTGTANFIISTLGINSNNTISGNTISNNSCASLAITSVISFTSVSNTPIVDITTNTIRNNTFTGAFSTARTISMLFYTGAGDVLNISGNQFIDNGITANNNNAVSITLNAVANNVSAGTTYNTETITNNTIDSLYIKGTSTAAQHIRGLNIYNADAAPVARTYSGNIIKKLAALTGTANTVLGINTGGINAPFNLFQNTIRRIYSNSAGANTITGVNLPAFTNPISIYNNTIDSVFTTAGTGASLTGINNAATGATSMYGNTISNMYFAANTGTSATIHGLLMQAPGDGSAVYENKISNLYFASNAAGATATITGVNIAAGTGYITAYKDSVAKLYTSATVSADIRGININNVSATVSNIYQNKVSELYPGQGAGASTVRGILLGLNSLATVYNNFVNIDLTSAPVPAANAVLTGIRSQAGILANNAGQKLFFNTVRLAGTGSGAAFSSTAVYNNSAAAFEMKNNIFVNLGTAVTPANVMAFTGAVATSDYNNWFATGQTLANVQAATGGDANSQNISPVFVSATDLHIQNTATNFPLEGTGTANAIADDIDGDSRASSTPVDLGADAMMLSPWPMYRSHFATGNWDTNTDWEESTDGGGTWNYPAVLKPAKNVNSGILVQAGHVMNVRLAGESMDHVIVQGTLVLQTGGTMELNNSGGTDMLIDDNGKLLVTTTANYAAAVSFTTNPDIIVDTLGAIQIGTGAATGTGYEGFATSTDNVWRHDSRFIWNNGLAFSGNATYFPNVATPAYVPVFSVLSTTATTGGTALVINGIFDIRTNVTFSTATGARTFKNGITGNSTLTIPAGGSGSQNITGTTPIPQFAISAPGATAILGGSTMLNLNLAKTLNIATTATVVVPKDSSVTISSTVSPTAISKAGTANFIVSGLADMTTTNMSNTAGAVTINGTLRTAAIDGLRGGGTATVSAGTVTVNHGSLVEYYAAGNQNVTGSGVLGGSTYHAIKFSGSGTKLLTNLANVHDSVIITGTAVVDAMSFNLGSSVGETFIMDGGRLRLGTVTTPGPLMDGVYKLTGGVVEFAGSNVSRQTIRGTQTNAYYNVEVTGTNVGQSSGNINIRNGGTFTIKSNAVLHMNDVSIVDSSGTGTQSFIMEANSKLFTANTLGFNGPLIGFNAPTVKSDIETINLATGSSIDYNRSNFYLGLANGNQVVTTTLPYQHLILSGDGNKTPAAGATIVVAGNLTKGGRPSAIFMHNDGTVELNSTTAQTYTDTAFVKQIIELNSLTLKNNGSVTLKNSIAVNQKMLFDNSTPNTVFVLDSGNVHLRSRADTTAWVAAIPSTVFINYDNAGTDHNRGRFVVERYNYNARKWRFYSIPDTTVQTINQAWQEGATNISQNPVPGYGTLIGSYYSNWNTPARQWFDMYTAGGHDMKWWSNDASQRYNTIGKTDTLIATNTGWMKFVRGDRTVTAGTGISLLRTRGKIKRNAQSVTFTATAANQYFSVGNPYPSSVDMRQISKSGFVSGPGARVQQFLIWDPRLGGAYGLGAFQAFAWDGTNYRVTPGGGSYGANGTVDNIIESGAAFFVQSSGIGAGTVSFAEATKVDGSREVFRINGLEEKLSVILESNPVGETPEVMDGLMAMFDDSYTNEIDANDLKKFANPGENISINKGDNNLLMIESHPSIVADDTLFLKISGMKARPYRLNIQPENMAKPGLMAWLVDKFTETSTPIDLLTGLIYNFDISTNPSAVPDRFMIVFKNATVVPVKIVSIAAERNNNGSNTVKWRVENETGVAHYELQRSHNGSNFTALQSNIAATNNNGGSEMYNRIDANPLVADNYYRIKATLQNGRIEYSAIVKLSQVKAPSSITVFPNPVKENRFNIEFVNQPEGRYVLDLLAANGQVVYSFAVMVTGNNFIKTITPARVIAGGTYTIRLTAPDGKIVVKKVMVE